MKTASWSLALVAAAGTVRATEEDCPEESSPAYSAPAYSAASSSWVSPASVSSVPAYPSWSASSESDPYSSSAAPSGPVIVTSTQTLTKTVCPCEKPTRTPGEVYTTITTTERTTTCPGTGHEATYSWGDWTSVYTSYEISTITDTFTTTCTEPYPESSDGAISSTAPAGYPSGSSPPYPYPSGSGQPSGYPSGGWGTGYPSSKPSGYPSGGWGTGYPSGTGYAPSSTWSGTASPTGTSGCIPCEGQPGRDPEKWCGYTIHDNWYEYTPKTCKTREYWWTITAQNVAPDGVERLAMIVNNQLPGPKIEANWGDEIIVHLTNGMSNDFQNGTSLHFHGIRQNGTNEMDGVSSITQCPIAPGHSMTYKWTANSYGTSWWHSHYALQTYEGVFGPMIIHGPSSMDYDDEVMVLAQDWNHETVNSLYYPSQVFGDPASGPQNLTTGLLNGMNVYENGGQYWEMTVESNKSYRIRLVNTAIQSTFVFYVDGHTFSVIAMDFVPITPYETDKVVINIGQRYDLIMKADQPSADYWMRADNQQPCGTLYNPIIKGIVHYSDGPKAQPDPTTPGKQYPPTCLDEPSASLVPIVPWTAGVVDQTIEEAVIISPQGGNPNLYKWTLSGTTFYAQWENPTLQSILDDGTIPDTSGNLAIEAPNLGEWVYVIIETGIPLPHPIHLHGHDFLILAQGLGNYTDAVELNLVNPPRRDVAVMPADPPTGQYGFLVVAFYTSNPGVWLMHCHIGWHNAMGFALQIIENLDGIENTIGGKSMIDETCAAWTTYANNYDVFSASEYDSGV